MTGDGASTGRRLTAESATVLTGHLQRITRLLRGVTALVILVGLLLVALLPAAITPGGSASDYVFSWSMIAFVLIMLLFALFVRRRLVGTQRRLRALLEMGQVRDTRS